MFFFINKDLAAVLLSHNSRVNYILALYSIVCAVSTWLSYLYPRHNSPTITMKFNMPATVSGSLRTGIIVRFPDCAGECFVDLI